MKNSFSKAHTSTQQEKLNKKLLRAFDSVNLKKIQKYLEKGADANTPTPTDRGNPLLHLTAAFERSDIMGLLIRYNADVNGTDIYNMTTLHCVALLGNNNATQLLLANNANTHAKDALGNTPLSFAAQKGHTTIIKLLIGAGADINTKNDTNITPLFLALLGGHTDAVKILLTAGARLQKSDKENVKTLLGIQDSTFDTLFETRHDRKKNTYYLLKDRTKPWDQVYREVLENQACLPIADIISKSGNIAKSLPPERLQSSILPHLSIKDIGALLCTAKPKTEELYTFRVTKSSTPDAVGQILSKKCKSFSDAIEDSKTVGTLGKQ
ncbi:MAG: uncharacterized protein K0R63_1474 [Rickettsiales bacterium]|jgi:ankyrin repeat protein|nr:uncharacterized protein [Rickettsiales bacterium]